MKNLIRFGMVALVALALAATGEARQGGHSQKLVFSGEGQFSHDNSTTASLWVASTVNRGEWFDGQVIVLEGVATIGTVDADGATMTIGASVGGSLMISAAVIMHDGFLKFRLVGTVRSISTSSAAGTILWTLEAYTDCATSASVAVDKHYFAADTTADALDTRTVRTQEIAVSVDWTAAESANTFDGDSLQMYVY